jgi:2-keto-4-pentenoate hydratase/2-oxohepta-3-ene-1,7-dioic acid hydratase in catechol pathway
MKISSYDIDGAETYGVVLDDGGLVDMGPRLGAKYPTLKSVLEAGVLSEVADAAGGQSADRHMDDVTLLPVITNPGKIICIGLNYRTHVEEGGRPIPEHPMIFMRFPEAQVGHNQPLIRPKASHIFDFEGEMALIIGPGGRHISEAESLNHITGYSCFNDGSIRDWQRHTSQFGAGKNFFHSGSFGPWMITSDECGAPDSHTLITRLNGEEMQRATTDDLLFNVPQLMVYCSTFIPLNPGDVIVTGTTGGVGFYRDPQVFMKPGDVIEIEVTDIGILKNTIVDEE